MKLNALAAVGQGLNCINKFSGSEIEQSTIDTTLHEFKKIFQEEKDFRKKIQKLDLLVDSKPFLLSVREFCFDLVLVDFLEMASDTFGEDFLESPQWNKIEDETIDRGTELLNVLLYLKECDLEKIEPELGDFLTEFLLVEEEEFQEEYSIYEDVIENQMLMESNYSEIVRINTEISDNSEIKEIFYPLMSFFLNTTFKSEDFKEMIQHSENKSADAFILGALQGYKST